MRISGNLDLCGPSLVEGWLYCDAWHGDTIRLQVYVEGDLIGECAVDRFRQDLQDAGFGDGRCGFSFSIPVNLGLTTFANTRLRLVDSPVYLLPNDSTNFGKPKAAPDDPSESTPLATSAEEVKAEYVDKELQIDTTPKAGASGKRSSALAV